MINIPLFFLLLSTSFEEEKLVFLLTLFRHGARAPTKYFDEGLHLDYILEKWENPGELTPIGQRMHYALGLRNREKYINQKHFLSEKYDPHEILVYSTKYNRTLLSAASQLQGLYPFNTGEEITNEQKNISVPPLELSKTIKSDLDKLNNNALPNQMTLVPIRMINDNERKISIDYIRDCKNRTIEIMEVNYKNSEELQNLVSNFTKKYNQTLNQIYEREIEYNYDFIENFCDAFISGTTEKKKMEKINSVEINQEELLKTCFELMKLEYKDHTSGDKERTIPTLEISKIIKEFIHYMKKRIDADISGENIKEKLEDYSRPKMLMISGHDYTISMWEMFFIKVFYNNNDTKFEFPKFAAQLTLEVVTENNTDSSKIKNYKDFTINCYLNDNLFFNKSVDEFISIVESNIFSDEQIDEYCGIKNNGNDKTDSDSKGPYFTYMIIFCVTSVLFIIIMAIFIIKGNKNKSGEELLL